ncbi:chorismate--pyruvate lyase family protein [Hydrocarboniclastica marina]|uniref:Probable chorismate pyruvate-lyase n=1 Tax=Hydrocarboniclastica marina TaxID=2259620 RepID=A0A4V1D936_9ALTE|nr:chorismate lyase [Hydrocarboniclastica marina]MAL97429.1 hypothetical protein [Alteromonadaceae bacterium]QCF27320.1 chorismate lyase [Hydrocarboniclastica marina]
MSPAVHALAYQDARFASRADFQLPRHRRLELHRPGSLSKWLQRWCPGTLPVTVLRQGQCLPTPDEARLLALKPRERVWVREVWLGPSEAPWVKGRTVTPLREMKGRLQALRNLGTRPLGSVLFTGPAWHRSAFLVGYLLPPDSHAHPLPARRSIFSHGQSRLLVTEGFCNAYWQRLEAENAARPRGLPARAGQSASRPNVASDHV